MQLEISEALLKKHPYLPKREIRMIIKAVWNHKSVKLKSGHIVNFTIPYFGKIKSHGNKKKNKYLALDRRHKRRQYLKKSMSKEKLLF